MCKAPKPPAIREPDDPEFLRNPFLDAAIGRAGVVDQLRTGRSSLRIPLNSSLGIRQPGEALTQPANTTALRPAPAATADPNLELFRGIASRLPGGGRNI